MIIHIACSWLRKSIYTFDKLSGKLDFEKEFLENCQLRF